MAQERITEYIRSYRLQYNDNWFAKGQIGYPGAFTTLADYREKDGTVLSRQLLGNMICDGCNMYIQGAVEYAKGNMNEVRRLADEYVALTTLDTFTSVNTFVMKKALPANHLATLLVTYLPANVIGDAKEASEIRDLKLLPRIYDGAAMELHKVPYYWISDGALHVAYTADGAAGPTANSDKVEIHYMKQQPYITVGGASTEDIAMRTARTQDVLRFVHQLVLNYKNYKG